MAALTAYTHGHTHINSLTLSLSLSLTHTHEHTHTQEHGGCVCRALARATNLRTSETQLTDLARRGENDCDWLETLKTIVNVEKRTSDPTAYGPQAQKSRCGCPLKSQRLTFGEAGTDMCLPYSMRRCSTGSTPFFGIVSAQVPRVQNVSFSWFL